jgi:sugar (pentulose or hexulose) kinase
MKKKVIAVFDIGKTNKKVLLFDEQLKIVEQVEDIFPEIVDEDGFPCDDAVRIETWISERVGQLLQSEDYDVSALNFSTYGATLVYLSADGNRIGPFYNYLKNIDSAVPVSIYERFGGTTEFCRKTASPALAMLNSGFQALWLKRTKPAVFGQVADILHLPQYLSYRFTGHKVSELTSIGCHTAMWDFDNHCYHRWLASEEINLPHPVDNNTCFEVNFNGKKLPVGIGIHDSSASLAPYLTLASEPFILISTGTWCITMNPFNDEPLTAEQLEQDCLSYMGVHQKPVKSSRLFLGHIFEVNVSRIEQFFGKEKGVFKSVKPDEALVKGLLENQTRYFFTNSLPADYIDLSADLSSFANFEAAYHQLVFDVAHLCRKSVGLVIPQHDTTKAVYITGGFSRNRLFVRLIANLLSDKRIFTSEIDNATALGAALMVSEPVFGKVNVSLGLKEIQPF